MGNYTNQMMDRDFGPVGPYSEEADERFLAEQMKNPPLGRAVNPDPQIEQKKMQNDQAERASAKAMDEQGLLKPHEKQMAVNQWGPFWKDIKEFGGKVGGVLSGMGDDLASGASSMNRRVQNDPKLAMAIAMAGFNIADPDSGFTNNPRDPYSAFRALKSGLGSGLQTYAQLSKPRELGFAEQERIKNKYKLQQIREKSKLGVGTGRGEYRNLLSELMSGKYPKGSPMYKRLSRRMEKLVRQDPTARMQNMEMSQFIHKHGSEDDKRMWDELAPRPIVLDQGGTKIVMDRSGGVIHEGQVTLKPSETQEHLGGVAQEKAERKIEGENIAEARWDAPKARMKVDSMLGLLDQIYKLGPDGELVYTHEGFEDLIGATWIPFKRHVHGTPTFALDKLVKQVKDKNFLEAFQALKGGGHITEIEGEKATDSIAAIHIGMPETDFIIEMEKVRSVLMRGLKIANEKIEGTIKSSSEGEADKLSPNDRKRLNELRRKARGK